ncbi:histone-like nucleoid-structuring protein Lsr2 [Intrasporangium mesophilum]
MRLLDDIDGTDASETITFGLDGGTYEIDLSDKNADKLRSSLDKWVGAARRVKTSGRAGRGPVTGRGHSPAERRAYLASVRVWAAKNGYSVAERGRVPGDIVAAYEASLR